MDEEEHEEIDPQLERNQEATSLDPRLLIAAKTNNKELLSQLVDLSEPTYLNRVTVTRNTVLHILASHGHHDIIETICSKNISFLDSRNTLLETPLHHAARAGNSQIVFLLIHLIRGEGGEEKVKELVRARNANKETALHHAVRGGHANVVEELICADFGVAGLTDDFGVSPLYFALSLGFKEVVQCLIRRMPEGEVLREFYEGPDKQTALHIAVLLNIGEIAEQLLTWNSKLEKETDASGRTPLHYAILTKDRIMFNLLLKHSNSALYISDNNGMFPLHIASMTEIFYIFSDLVEKCPDYDELLDNQGRNSLHLAIEHKNKKIVGYLCKSTRFVNMLNAKDRDGNTPLHLAVKNKNFDGIVFLVQNERVHLNMVNKDGLTPLDLAYMESDCSLYSVMNTEGIILHCLLWAGATQSPFHCNPITQAQQMKVTSEKVINKLEKIAPILIISSLLIASISFAAILSIISAYKSDDHTSTNTAKRLAFRGFIIFDSLAFFYSITSVRFLRRSSLTVIDTMSRVNYIMKSGNNLEKAIGCLITSFSLGVYVVMSSVNEWIAFVVCLFGVLAVPYGRPPFWNLVFVAGPIRRRAGWKGLVISKGYNVRSVVECVRNGFLFRVLIGMYLPLVLGVFVLLVAFLRNVFGV
ncbi:hypothetical protein LUZ60_014409 [Juncus effusus]|nr:hypothetical protein LUZ60_014409 [Juncus effusus]